MADSSELEYDEEQSGDLAGTRPAAGSADGLPIKEGAVFGVVGVVVTYLSHLYLTMVAAGQATPETYTDDGSIVVTDMVSSWTAAGWSYLGTFGVGFEAGGEPVSPRGIPNHAAGFYNAPFGLADTLLAVTTVGILVALGYAVARYTDADDAVEAVKAGVTVVPPYLVFGVAAAFLLTHTFSDAELVGAIVEPPNAIDPEPFLNDENEITGDITVEAATSDAVLFAGVLFPALFAIVGALLSQWNDAVDRAIAAVVDR